MARISKEGMLKPGDVIIDEITLKSYTGFKMSLKGIFQNFVIYEDIFSNCMSGSITLVDSMNFVKHFPIIGAEELTIVYKTPFGDSPPVKLTFRTYKISVMVETQQHTTQVVRVEFISSEAIRSMQQKVSKSFRNMPVSRIVESIYDEYLAREVQADPVETPFPSIVQSTMQSAVSSSGIGELFANQNQKRKIKTIEITSDNRSYVIPYWNPFYAINWLCHRARSQNDQTYCDYVFFENSDGHHFVPLSRLKRATSQFTYTNYPPGFRDINSDRMIEAEMRNVFTATVRDSADRIKQQNTGMYASTMLTHDLTTKTYNTFSMNYDQKFDEVGEHVETNRLLPLQKTDYSSAIYSHIKYYPSTTYNMAGLERTADHEETVLYRQSLLSQITSMNILLECHGDTNVKVGQIIEFAAIAKESTKGNDKYEDDYLRGRYLVTAIKHVINDRSHRMTITISRDSLAEPLADYKKPTLV